MRFRRERRVRPSACSKETNEKFLQGITQKDAAMLIRIIKKMLDNADGPVEEL